MRNFIVINLKFLIIVMVALLGTPLYSQNEISPRTQLGIQMGANYSVVTRYGGQSIGGEWGVQLDHLFKNQKWGFQTGLNFLLLHVDTEEGFGSPSETPEFRMLETPFDVIFCPKSDRWRINGGLAYGLVLLQSYGRFEDLEYGKLILRCGVEYDIKTESSLALRLGAKYRTFKFDDSILGRFHILSLTATFGLKA